MSKNTDTCEDCRNALQVAERLVTVYRHRRSKHFIFEQVPARVCTRCGERYFSSSVVRAMEQEMRTRHMKPTVSVPIIALRVAVTSES
jgi:YgiT-type zinc finger domain-containing protein